MGYDLHITRKDDWADEDGPTISEQEWRCVIEEDPELQLDPDTRCTMADGEFICAAWKGEAGALGYYNGEVRTKNPTEPLIRKMVAVAQRLSANVQGDDGERYPEALDLRSKRKPTSWPRKLMRGLIIVLFAFLTVGFVVHTMASVAEGRDTLTSVVREHARSPLNRGVLSNGLLALVFGSATVLVARSGRGKER